MKCPSCKVSYLKYEGYKRMDIWVTPHTKIRFAHSYICRNLLCRALIVRWHGRFVVVSLKEG